MTATEVKSLRKRLKLTQEQLAKKLGVTRQTIINWESASKRPSPLAERQLARLERKNG